MKSTLFSLEQAHQLLAVTGALTRAVTASDVKRVILEQALQLTGAYEGTLIKVIDEQTLYLVGSARYETPVELSWQRITVDANFPVVTAIREQRPVFATVDEVHHAYPDLTPLLQPGTRAVAAVPLIAAGRVLSGLTLSFNDEHAITPQQQAFILSLVEQCAPALERARSYDAEHQARERATLLAHAGTVLASTLDVHDTLERITALAIQHVADWCAVYQPDQNGRMRPVAVAHQEPQKAELLREFLDRFPSDPQVYGTSAWVMRTGDEVLIPALPPALVATLPTEEQRQALRQLGLHSLILVPMTAQGRRVGVLGFATAHPSRTYGSEDLALARELAQRAALALGNSELYRASQESEERYRSLVDATRQVVWTTSPDGQLLGEQPGWSRLTGQTREAYQGYGWSDAIHQEDRGFTVDAWQRAVAERSTYEVEHRVKVSEGQYRHFHARAVPVRNEEGEVREWVGVHSDITEQVRAEEVLRESAARFRMLADANPIGVVLGHPDGRIPYLNDAYLRLIQVSREQYEAGGLNWQAITPAEWLHADEQAIRQAYERGYSDSYEKEYILPDGQRLPVLVSLARAGTDGDALVAYVLDLTDRKALERSLSDQNAKLQSLNRQILESAGEGIFGLDLAGRVTFANPASLAITGFTAEALLGQSIHPLLHHSHLNGAPYPEEECPIQKSRQDGQVRRVDNEVFWRQGGTSFPVEYIATPLREARGEIEGVVVTFKDITDRKRVEEELRRSNAELERFAYVASHDLQEPLRTISSFAELLDRRYGEQLDESGRKYLSLLTRGAQRLKVLVDDLLVFSRLNMVREPLGPVQVEVPLQEALVRLHSAVEQTGAHVQHEPLPVVLGDEGELTQVFQNLIGNAIKFRRPGVVPVVRIDARDEGELWRFTVTDNGIGIEAQYFERAFGLFQRLHLRDKYEGTGLGLAIVRKIVEWHGGRTWLESEPGVGTTVHFTLRKAEDAHD